MLNLPPSLSVYVCSQVADMRRSFDGLIAMIQQYMDEVDVYGHHLFVFRNRNGDRLKLLYWEGDGFVIWYKRLEEGVFQLPTSCDDYVQISAAQMAMLLEGIDIRNVARRRRFDRKTSKSCG